MANSNEIGSPFEQSFMFHMIRDFFLLLLLVSSLEMAIRYALLRYDFASNEQARVEQATAQLANDVKSIMLNSGGPLAARTVYPILNRNYDDLGLSIAIIPAEVTKESMRKTFNMEVKGLQPVWKTGDHLESSVSLTAEQFCLNCHVKAQVGDVLGVVKVASYLAPKEMAWWNEVKLTGIALSLKIMVHTILLFFLLKLRMAPLLYLRTTVGELSKGIMDLSPRAKIKSHDEFGELAQDLNHFLDRITVVVTDLDQILTKVVEVSNRLGYLNQDLEEKVDNMRDDLLRANDKYSEDKLEQYRSVSQTLREMAQLEVTMQNIAESGHQVLQRITNLKKSGDKQAWR